MVRQKPLTCARPLHRSQWGTLGSFDFRKARECLNRIGKMTQQVCARRRWPAGCRLQFRHRCIFVRYVSARGGAA